MHLVAGVYQPDSGTIELDGASIANLNEHATADAGVAMVFQERSLVGALSVAENVYAGRQPVNTLGVIRRAPMFEGRGASWELEVDIDPRTPVCQSVARPAADGRDRQGPVARVEALILDEPTSSLTINEGRHLFRVISAWRPRASRSSMSRTAWPRFSRSPTA